jgi:phosphatidylglycerol---prolipoprotein diacylglyceryl transferase
MLPVLVHFTFDSPGSQLLLAGLALALVAYIAFNGWRGAPAEASRQARLRRALLYGAVGAALAFYGLRHALPATAIPGGRGEGLPLHSYGLLLAMGFLLAASVAARLARDEWRRLEWVADGQGGGQWVDIEGPRRREQVLDLSLWILLGGLVGSRLLFVLVNWQEYARDWSKVFSPGGGLVFYGGLIGAGVTAWVVARQAGMDFLRLADVLIPTVSLGQCLGRLGCYAAGCCWGDVAAAGSRFMARFPGAGLAKDLFGQLPGTSSLAFQSQAADARYVVEASGLVLPQLAPGAVRISDWVARHGTTLPVYPTQIYESLGQLLLFVALLYARRLRRFHGQIFALWLMAYALLRSTVELFRGDVERGTLHGLLGSLGAQGLARAVPLEAWYNVSTSQFISLCLFIFGATLLSQRNRAGSEARVIGSTARPAGG